MTDRYAVVDWGVTVPTRVVVGTAMHSIMGPADKVVYWIADLLVAERITQVVVDNTGVGFPMTEQLRDVCHSRQQQVNIQPLEHTVVSV